MGQVFGGRYELIDPIADGGMGSVWRVRDHDDGTIKAAKLLRHRDASSLLRFIREQGTRIHHPHVVTPLGWLGVDDDVLFTMPLVRGGSVDTLLGDYGALPEQWVATILLQTLDGLAAVHAMGVVHRDVKPANLLLEPTGVGVPHVRLTDFGIAIAVDEPRLTQAFATVGTPGYAPPERLTEPDPRHDLYALGVTGLQMLTDRRPPHDPADLPDTPLGRALAQATDPDPVRRPASAEAFAESIRAAVPPAPWQPGEIEVIDHFEALGGPVTAPTAPLPTRTLPTGTSPSAARDGDRPWWPIALLAAVGLALVAVGLVVLL